MKIKKCFIIIILLLLIIGTTNVYAFSNAIENENYEGNITEEYVLPTASITAQNFIPKYNSFRVYNSSEFEQIIYDNNCGMTLAANILSYYKNFGFPNLYSGEITQEMYNVIAREIGYTPSGGSKIINVQNGVKYFAEKAGYGFESNVYWLNLWTDVTRDIKLGYPIAAKIGDHGFMILGYRIIDGVKQIYTCTGFKGEDYRWINFDGSGAVMHSIHLYNK